MTDIEILKHAEDMAAIRTDFLREWELAKKAFEVWGCTERQMFQIQLIAWTAYRSRAGK